MKTWPWASTPHTWLVQAVHYSHLHTWLAQAVQMVMKFHFFLNVLSFLKSTHLYSQLWMAQPEHQALSAAFSSEERSSNFHHQHPGLDLQQTQTQQLYVKGSKFSDLCKLISFGKNSSILLYYYTIRKQNVGAHRFTRHCKMVKRLHLWWLASRVNLAGLGNPIIQIPWYCEAFCKGR